MVKAKRRRKKGDENTDISVPTLSVDMSVSLASSFLRSFTHPRFATLSLYCVDGGKGGGREKEEEGEEGEEGYYTCNTCTTFS